jgi:hypothetical protein
MRKHLGRGESATLGKETANVYLFLYTFARPVMNLVDNINHTEKEMLTNLVQGPLFAKGGRESLFRTGRGWGELS